MNDQAVQHLAKARDYIAKGDEFYRKAKPEIEAAIAAGASQREVSRFLLRSQSWVRDVLAWNGKGTLYGNDTERRRLDMAKQVLRESGTEQIADIIESDPQIQEKVEAAASHTSTKRQERKRIEADRKFREEVGDETADGLRLTEAAQQQEMLLINAHGQIKGFTRSTTPELLEFVPDSWRTSCETWLERIEVEIGMCRALLAGEISDEALAAFLSERS